MVLGRCNRTSTVWPSLPFQPHPPSSLPTLSCLQLLNCAGDSGPPAFAYAVLTAWNALLPDSPGRCPPILSRFTKDSPTIIPLHQVQHLLFLPPPPCRRKDVFPTSTTKLSHSSCPFKLRPCVFKSYLVFKAQLNVHEVLFGSLPLLSYWCFLRLQLFLSSTDKTFLAFSLWYNYWQTCLTPSCTANS